MRPRPLPALADDGGDAGKRPGYRGRSTTRLVGPRLLLGLVVATALFARAPIGADAQAAQVAPARLDTPPTPAPTPPTPQMQTPPPRASTAEVASAAELLAALEDPSVGKVVLSRSVRLPPGWGPAVLRRPVTVTSSIRAVVDFCADGCGGGSAGGGNATATDGGGESSAGRSVVPGDVVRFVVAPSGSLSLHRVFLRNWIPVEGSPAARDAAAAAGAPAGERANADADAEGPAAATAAAARRPPPPPPDVACSPLPGVRVDPGGALSLSLAVLHWTADSLWLLSSAGGWWRAAAEAGAIKALEGGGRGAVAGPLVADGRPRLHSVKGYSTGPEDDGDGGGGGGCGGGRSVRLSDCFMPFDTAGCMARGAPFDEALVYCPYTTFDALRNPQASRVRVFHPIGLDRLAYSPRRPLVVARRLEIGACAADEAAGGWPVVFDMDDVTASVLVDTGGLLTFADLALQGSRGQPRGGRAWPGDLPLLLGAFQPVGSGRVVVRGSTLRVASPRAVRAALDAMPGGAAGGLESPDLSPVYADEGAQEEGDAGRTQQGRRRQLRRRQRRRRALLGLVDGGGGAASAAPPPTRPPARRLLLSVAPPPPADEAPFTIRSWAITTGQWQRFVHGGLEPAGGGNAAAGGGVSSPGGGGGGGLGSSPGGAGLASWALTRVRVERWEEMAGGQSDRHCFHGALTQAAVSFEGVRRAATGAELRDAMRDPSARYVQVVADLAWPAADEDGVGGGPPQALVDRVLEVRACRGGDDGGGGGGHGGPFTVDWSAAPPGAVQVGGALYFQGDMRMVGLGWRPLAGAEAAAGAAQAAPSAASPGPPLPVPAVRPVGDGLVAYEDVELAGEVPRADWERDVGRGYVSAMLGGLSISAPPPPVSRLQQQQQQQQQQQPPLSSSSSFPAYPGLNYTLEAPARLAFAHLAVSAEEAAAASGLLPGSGAGRGRELFLRASMAWGPPGWPGAAAPASLAAAAGGGGDGLSPGAAAGVGVAAGVAALLLLAAAALALAGRSRRRRRRRQGALHAAAAAAAGSGKGGDGGALPLALARSGSGSGDASPRAGGSDGSGSGSAGANNNDDNKNSGGGSGKARGGPHHHHTWWPKALLMGGGGGGGIGAGPPAAGSTAASAVTVADSATSALPGAQARAAVAAAAAGGGGGSRRPSTSVSSSGGPPPSARLRPGQRELSLPLGRGARVGVAARMLNDGGGHGGASAAQLMPPAAAAAAVGLPPSLSPTTQQQQPPQPPSSAAGSASWSASQALRDAAAAGGPADEHVVLEGVLGEGAHGRVYRGRWRGAAVAVKVVRLPASVEGGRRRQSKNGGGGGGGGASGGGGRRERRRRMALMEIAISASLSHPNIVQTYTYAVVESPLTGGRGRGPEDDDEEDDDDDEGGNGGEGGGEGGGGGSGGLDLIAPPPGNGGHSAPAATAARALHQRQQQHRQAGEGGDGGGDSSGSAEGDGDGDGRCDETGAAAAADYELRIIQEYCDRGSLRDFLRARGNALSRTSAETPIDEATATATAAAAGADGGQSGQSGSFAAAAGGGAPSLPQHRAELRRCLRHLAVLDTATDVARALAHLHAQRLLHADVKSSNCLLKTTTAAPPPHQQEPRQDGGGGGIGGGGGGIGGGGGGGGFGFGLAFGFSTALAEGGNGGGGREEAELLAAAVAAATSGGGGGGDGGRNSSSCSNDAQRLAAAAARLLPPRGFVAKIADFGLTRRLEDSKATHVSGAFVGTLSHMAPEVLLRGTLSRQSDSYAFGVLLWELYSAARPFRGVPRALLGHGVARDGLRPRFPPDAPFDYSLLAARCWESDPGLRPSFDEALRELARQRRRAAASAAAAAVAVAAGERAAAAAAALLLAGPGGPRGHGGGGGGGRALHPGWGGGSSASLTGGSIARHGGGGGGGGGGTAEGAVAAAAPSGGGAPQVAAAAIAAAAAAAAGVRPAAAGSSFGEEEEDDDADHADADADGDPARRLRAAMAAGEDDDDEEEDDDDDAGSGATVVGATVAVGAALVAMPDGDGTFGDYDTTYGGGGAGGGAGRGGGAAGAAAAARRRTSAAERSRYLETDDGDGSTTSGVGGDGTLGSRSVLSAVPRHE